ncbi:MAG: ADP-ribosylglycohydrolase family protein [Candidatus Thiodiazotropha sp.]
MHRQAPPPVDQELSQKATAAYLGLAMGDALGATTEFLTPKEIQTRYGVHKTIRGGGWLKLKPGQVTDDTEMSLALGEAILRSGGVSARSVAQAFSDWMKRKPIDIGNTVRRGIIQFRNTGNPWVDENFYDAGNGACMRCLQIALAYHASSADALVVASRTQAHTTHNNPLSDAGTETVLRMIVAAMKGAPREELLELTRQLVDEYREYRFDRRRVENPSGYIVETLQVVFRGDADTTGAIAGMLAGAYYGLSAIPEQWVKKLNSAVRKRCQNQAEALMTLAREITNLEIYNE